MKPEPRSTYSEDIPAGEAVVFFVSRGVHYTAKKVFKLLYMLDVEHCLKVGKPVTRQRWLAHAPCPVPEQLAQTFRDSRCAGTLWGRLQVHQYKETGRNARTGHPETVDREWFEIIDQKPGVDANLGADLKWFSNRQLEIMGRLALRYGGEPGGDIDVSDVDKGLWRKFAPSATGPRPSVRELDLLRDLFEVDDTSRGSAAAELARRRRLQAEGLRLA